MLHNREGEGIGAGTTSSDGGGLEGAASIVGHCSLMLFVAAKKAFKFPGC